jgi:pimeloyl-ACP methyl ester carboxylesterase
MLQEKIFDTGEISINYAEGPPSGPPIVLLHGLPGRWQEFLPLLPSLTMRWQIYALDSRGQGKSGRVPGKYRPEHYIADVTAFLQTQLKDPAVLFGASAGGVAALAVAAQVPEKVRALVIGDSPIDIQALTAWMSSDAFAEHFSAQQDLAGSGLSIAALARALGDLPAQMMGQDPPLTYKELPGMDMVRLLAWAKTVSQLDPGVLAYHATGRGQEYLTGFDMDGIFQQVECPVLLIRADPELGALMSAEAAEHAVSILADGVQIMLDGVGHNLGLDTWEVGPVLRAVMGYLESL